MRRNCIIAAGFANQPNYFQSIGTCRRVNDQSLAAITTCNSSLSLWLTTVLMNAIRRNLSPRDISLLLSSVACSTCHAGSYMAGTCQTNANTECKGAVAMVAKAGLWFAPWIARLHAWGPSNFPLLHAFLCRRSFFGFHFWLPIFVWPL